MTVGVTGRSGDTLARMTCTMAAATACTATVAGTAGADRDEPRFYGLGTTLRLVGPDDTVLDTWEPESREHGFRYQVAEVARAVGEGRTETWSVPWEATRRVMAVMDGVRGQVGVVYPGE